MRKRAWRGAPHVLGSHLEVVPPVSCLSPCLEYSAWCCLLQGRLGNAGSLCAQVAEKQVSPAQGQAGATPSEGVWGRVEFMSEDGCWVPVGGQQGVRDILSKGSGHSLGVSSDRTGLKAWPTTTGGATLGLAHLTCMSQVSPPALIPGHLRDASVTRSLALCCHHWLESHREPLSLADPFSAVDEP